MRFCNFWTVFWSEESKHIQARCCGGEGCFPRKSCLGPQDIIWENICLILFQYCRPNLDECVKPNCDFISIWSTKELLQKITVLSSFSTVGKIFKLSSRKCFCDFQIILFRVVKNILFWLVTLVNISHFLRDPNLLKFTSLKSACCAQIYSLQYSHWL